MTRLLAPPSDQSFGSRQIHHADWFLVTCLDSCILQLLHTILASCSVYSLPEHDCRDFLLTTSVHIYLSLMSLAPFITQLGAEIEDASEGDCLESKPLVSSSEW
jgi:hypothetical protein